MTVTNQDFVDLINRSGLLAQSHIDAYLKKFQARGPLPSDPEDLAEMFVQEGLLTPFQVMQLMVGKTFGFFLQGKYKLLELLGAGGMGSVFLCEHVHLQRLLAIKVLPKDKTAPSGTVERFYREARASASLEHPNIVRALDVDRDGDTHFLVMEYVDGNDLRKIVELKGPLSCPRAANYMYQAAVGLQYAHEAGWVHRDIKPANILLDRKGVIKILDMGLARMFLDEGDSLTRQFSDNPIMGTVDYMAPEQSLDSHSADIRSDIYSLGATFYFLLAGQPMFQEASVRQKLLWHQVRHPTPIHEVRPEVPAPMALVLNKMLAKEPAERYQTPAEVARALATWKNPPPPPSEQEMPFINPARLQLGLADPGQAQSAADSGLLNQINTPSSDTPTSAPSVIAGMPNVGASRAGQSKLAQSKVVQSKSAHSKSVRPSPTIAARPGAKTGERPKAPPTDPNVGPRGDPSTQVPSRPSRSREPSGTEVSLPSSTAAQRGASGPARLAGPTRASMLFVLIGVVALIAVVVPLVGRNILWPKPEPTKPPTGDQTVHPTGSNLPEGPNLFVTHNQLSPFRNRPNVFDSVRKALLQAKPGDRIALLDKTYEEQLDLKGAEFPAGITLESNPDSKEPTEWKLPADLRESVPILSLTDVRGWTIRRLVFDGESRTDKLLAVAGACPGLRVENVSLRGFRTTGLSLDSCTAPKDAPISLRQLLFVAPLAKPPDAGLLVSGAAPSLPTAQNIQIEDSLFKGKFAACVRFTQRVGYVQFTHNRFYRAQSAVAYQPAEAPSKLVMTANTFYDIESCFDFAQLASAGPNRSITMKSNIFSQMPSLVRLSEPNVKLPAGLFQDCEHNVRDPESCAKGPVPFTITQTTITLNTDPGDNTQLLRYPSNSPLAKAGPDNTPLGAPPLDR